MNIEWTLCSERMPPRSTSRMIFKENNSNDIFIAESITPHIFYTNSDNLSWTEFTKEKWEFLNR